MAPLVRSVEAPSPCGGRGFHRESPRVLATCHRAGGEGDRHRRNVFELF